MFKIDLDQLQGAEGFLAAGLVLLLAFAILHVAVAVAIGGDVKKLHRARRLLLSAPGVWTYGALLLGPIVVPFYWLFHYSRFSRPDGPRS